MNTKSNQRYLETEQSIQNAFIKLLEMKDVNKITVHDICTIAQINRSSFYLHYEDITALMQSIEKNMEIGILGELYKINASAEDLLRKDYLIVSMKYIKEHHIFYHAFLNYRGMHFLDFGMQNLWEPIYKPFFLKMGVASEREMKYHIQFFNAGLIMFLKMWLDDKCPEPPDKMAEIIWGHIQGISH